MYLKFIKTKSINITFEEIQIASSSKILILIYFKDINRKIKFYFISF